MTWAPPQSFPDLSAAKLIAIDCETRDDGLREKGPGTHRGSYIVGLAVATEFGRWYFPIRHAEGGNLDEGAVRNWAKRELCRPNQPKIGANILYDLEFITAWGVPITGPFLDVQGAEALIDETQDGFSLEKISQNRLGEGKSEDHMQIAALERGIKKDYKSMIWRLPASAVGEYAERDAELCLRLWAVQRPILERDRLIDVFKLECRQLPLLLAMRMRGVRVDLEYAEALMETCKAHELQNQGYLDQQAGFAVDVNRPGSIEMACKKLGLTYPRTAKGSPSFTTPWMSKQPQVFWKRLVAVRKYQKYLGTFLQNAIADMAVDGRIYCQFHPLRGGRKEAEDVESGTAIGRYSSTNPNLQQIPGRDEFGKKIREIFLPEDGEFWAKLDYSQIEPRVALHYSRGPIADNMREQYRKNPELDCYNLMLETMPKGITRPQVKEAWLGTMYGMGPDKMAYRMDIPVDQAKAIRQGFFDGAPYLRDLAERAGRVAEENGYVRTIMGRRRHFNLWEPRDREKKSVPIKEYEARARYGDAIKRAYTYKAIQSVVSGSSADCLKLAMAKIWESGVCDVLGAPLLTIHDELDWSVPNTAAGREALAEAKQIMENAYEFSVPLLADLEEGDSWGTVK